MIATGYGYAQQQDAARRDSANIQAGYDLQTRQLMERYNQINQQASKDMGERAREARIEMARLRAVGAESGLGGLTQGRMERESAFLAGSDMATIESNRVNALAQSLSEGQGASLESKARLGAVNSPSGLGAGLQIANAGFSKYLSGLTLQEKTKQSSGS